MFAQIEKCGVFSTKLAKSIVRLRVKLKYNSLGQIH